MHALLTQLKSSPKRPVRPTQAPGIYLFTDAMNNAVYVGPYDLERLAQTIAFVCDCSIEEANEHIFEDFRVQFLRIDNAHTLALLESYLRVTLKPIFNV